MKPAPRKVDESPVAPEKAAPPVFEETQETQGSANAGSGPTLKIGRVSNRFRSSNAARQARRTRMLQAGKLNTRMTNEEAMLAITPPYQRPAVPHRQPPAGFEVVCNLSSHCYHAVPKDGIEDVRIIERCCGCEKERLIAKAVTPVSNFDSVAREEAARKLLSRWQGGK